MGQVFSMGAHLRRFIAEKDPQHAAVLLEQSLTAIEKVKATMAKARELPQRTIGISAETAVEMAKGAEKPMQPSPGPGRGRKTSVNNTRFTDQRGSTNSSYLAARLKRDHPDIAARVANGEFKSIRAAALEAGIVKAVRHGDTRTIDLFAEPEARPVAAPTPPRPAVSTPAATGPATSLKQLPVKVITRKDGHTQTYHVAPEDESGSFGPVFRQFRHGGQGAVAHLTKIKTGEAVAALHHPEVGDIDLVWGQEGTAAKGYEDGYGLAKIAVKHPNILNNLQGALDTLQEDKEKSTDAYKILTSPDHKAIVRMDWDRKAKTWLLTAYSIQEAPGAGTRAGAAKLGEAARASTGSTQSLAPSPDLGNQPPPDRTALVESISPRAGTLTARSRGDWLLTGEGRDRG